MHELADSLISQKVLLKSFFKSQSPHESVNLSFVLTDMGDEARDLE